MLSLRTPIFRPNKRTVFSWRDHTHCQLLVDGEQFFPAMLEAIEHAKSYVIIEMYLVQSGKVMTDFIDVLTQKAHEGVLVQLLLDDFGARDLNKQDRNCLEAAGVELFFYNPVQLSRLKLNLHRTHRKIIVIDGKVAFTGGAGFTDSFMGKYGWRENMIKVEGDICQDWQLLFSETLQHCCGNQSSALPLVLQSPVQNDGQAQTRVVYSNGGTQIDLKRSLLNRIQNSKHVVWLATAYFIPSRKIRRALRRAAFQGKDVRLLLPGEITDHPAVVYASRRYYAKLLRDGVRIYEYQGRFMHTKVFLVDDWCSIGSSNMDRWNLRWNLEANQEVRDADFATDVKSMLQNDLNHCIELDYQEWIKRSAFQRLREWLWGKVDRWLTSWREK